MHEFSITQNVLQIALDEAEKVQARRITRINLVLGELAGVVGECIQFYFDFLSQDSIAEKAVLAFTTVPIKLHCRDCSNPFSSERTPWFCPNCQSQNLEIMSGQECYIESIEVE